MPVMSQSNEAEKGDGGGFKWGKKRGLGGKNQDAQFYESFTYEGTEYFLYDCVYVYKEGEPEPHIGKLVKIWEQKSQKKKKIKILWFFRPIELLNLLGDGDEPLGNEIFLASGEGVGLYNMNPLEVINGKCNIVCTSKDARNPQPSEDELKAADYIFYRTFDVGTYTISDKFEDNIAGIEVRYIFNRTEGKGSRPPSKPEANGKDDKGNIAASDKALLLDSKNNSLEALECAPKDDKVDAGLKISPVIPDRGKSEDSIPKSRQLVEDRVLSGKGQGPNEVETKAAENTKLSTDKNAAKAGTALIGDSENKEKLIKVKDSDLDNRPPKKAKLNSDKVSSAPALNKVSKTGNSVKRPRVDSDEDDAKGSDTPISISDSKASRKSTNDLVGQDNRPSKKAKPDVKDALPSEEIKHKGSAPEKDNKSDGQIFEVTRRPDADKSKWFKQLPWEERMIKAREQGTLLLLENLDPSYTSTEIEDVIWSGFRESCTAKMVPRTMLSSPHCGHAFVIFKSREAADMAVKRLNEGCLMLPNGRPLIGSKGTHSVLGITKFFGHLSIDKIKAQMQREEMRKAVSTSHCSQPNTIEYDMAMDWRFLQEKSDRWWKELFKQHGEELKKLKMNFKTKQP